MIYSSWFTTVALVGKCIDRSCADAVTCMCLLHCCSNLRVVAESWLRAVARASATDERTATAALSEVLRVHAGADARHGPAAHRTLAKQTRAFLFLHSLVNPCCNTQHKFRVAQLWVGNKWLEAILSLTMPYFVYNSSRLRWGIFLLLDLLMPVFFVLQGQLASLRLVNVLRNFP